MPQRLWHVCPETPGSRRRPAIGGFEVLQPAGLLETGAIQADFDACQEVDDLRRWAEGIIDAGGRVPVVEVIDVQGPLTGGEALGGVTVAQTQQLVSLPDLGPGMVAFK